ncbi:MAG: aspartate-semialdehyde dehydrogenase [Rhodobacterales bacterium]|nr:aspartate-semialdehyde dehydrogenase [Rhodobacterales bacterium]
MSMLERQLNNYRITTAEILYRMPDTPAILQTFIWQNLDLAPHFPELRKFLDFWEARLDGPLHSVRVAAASVIMPPRYRCVAGDFRLH